MRPIILFTDFGAAGSYIGQVKAALLAEAPAAPVIDLVADAPAFAPKPSAYLLAALVAEMPARSVMLCVVDPGVGGPRVPMVAEIDGRLFVGPDNGLFEVVARRAAGCGLARRAHAVQAWRIVWRPGRLSATFHGRDLFAPIAGRLARGLRPEQVGCAAMDVPARADWPDDLAEIIYIDHYGNALTGLRAASVTPDRGLVVGGGGAVMNARHYAEMPEGAAFWYENSIGLVEVAVSGGRADVFLGIGVGSGVSLA